MGYQNEKPKLNSPLNSAEVRGNFEFLKKGIKKEHRWDDQKPETLEHNLDEMKAVVPQPEVAQRYTTGSHKGYDFKYTKMIYHHIPEDSSSGSRSLQDILQELVKRSHSHSFETNLYGSNCNCNCNCSGNN